MRSPLVPRLYFAGSQIAFDDLASCELPRAILSPPITRKTASNWWPGWESNPDGLSTSEF